MGSGSLNSGAPGSACTSATTWCSRASGLVVGFGWTCASGYGIAGGLNAVVTWSGSNYITGYDAFGFGSEWSYCWPYGGFVWVS